MTKTNRRIFLPATGRQRNRTRRRQAQAQSEGRRKEARPSRSVMCRTPPRRIRRNSQHATTRSAATVRCTRARRPTWALPAVRTKQVAGGAVQRLGQEGLRTATTHIERAASLRSGAPRGLFMAAADAAVQRACANCRPRIRDSQRRGEPADSDAEQVHQPRHAVVGRGRRCGSPAPSRRGRDGGRTPLYPAAGRIRERRPVAADGGLKDAASRVHR